MRRQGSALSAASTPPSGYRPRWPSSPEAPVGYAFRSGIRSLSSCAIMSFSISFRFFKRRSMI